MTGKKNVQLSDEMLLNATGGLNAGEQNAPEFDAIGTVVIHLGGRQYQVRFDDGAELIAATQSDETVPDGAKVGLFAVAGGWKMHVLANN